MKKLMIAGTIALCAGLVFADETNIATQVEQTAPVQEATAKKKHKATPEEIRARRAARIESEGGLVVAPAQGRVVRILCKTDKITLAELDEISTEITGLLGFVIEVVDSNKATSQRTGCLITLLEQNGAPTILVAPEEPWAVVNVKNLAKDNPKPEVLKTRIHKELWRALAFAMGAANSNMQPCLMRPIFSLRDLDAEKVSIISPDPLMAISQTAERLNFAKFKRVTYKTAVVEGWASQPTNQVQQAVWDQVKAEQAKVPTKPLKITPGMKPKAK